MAGWFVYFVLVEDEFPATRGNICIFKNICTIKFLYQEQSNNHLLIYSSDIQVNYYLHL